MIQLPDNCRIGKFSVFPKNWDRSEAKTNFKWRLTYRFYDDNLQKSKQIKFEAMNSFADLKARQMSVKNFIDSELEELKHNGYNPILDSYKKDEAKKHNQIDEATLFVPALEFALSKNETSEKQNKEYKRYTDNIVQAIHDEGLDKLKIGDVRLKHLYLIFDRLKKNLTQWSDNMYNCHRTTLTKLYSTLERYDAVPNNFPMKMARKIVLHKKREILTDNECEKVYNFLKEKYYSFWRFMGIFYESGCRETEMLRILVEDVNIDRREFWVVVYKGGKPRREKRAISLLTLPLWKEVIDKATGPKQYLFSKGLVPGNTAISPKQITKRWYKHVKGNKKRGPKLNLTADFYSLKHLYLDRLSAMASEDAARQAAGHRTLSITQKHYLVTREERELAERKKLQVSFLAV